MGDLEGHRIRIGTIRGSKILELKKGQILWLTQENVIKDLRFVIWLKVKRNSI